MLACATICNQTCPAWRLIRGRTNSCAALKLTTSERDRLERLAGSRTAPRREVERAQILLRYANGETVTAIHRTLQVSRSTVYKCIDKALAAGVQSGLKDTYHRPREAVIGGSEKSVCPKPGLPEAGGFGLGCGTVDRECLGTL